MPKFLIKRLHTFHRVAIYSSFTIMLLILSWYSWIWGVIGFFVLGALIYFASQVEKKFQVDLEQYISTLSYRIKKVGEDVISDLPVGIILYNDDKKIEWYNKHFLTFVENDHSVVGKTIGEVIPKLDQWLSEEKEEGTIRHEGFILQIVSHPKERSIYLLDQTEFHKLQVKHRQGQAAYMHIHLDNLDEETQGTDEQYRTLLQSHVTRTINQWAQEMGIYLKRTNADKFFGILNEQILRKLEENKFEIIDKVRDLTSNNKIPVTLSIGVGAGTESFLELGQLSQSSLDIALGRGGDQAAVKRGSGKVTFFGGKSNAVEKRTRVRARVISHALRDLIQESDRVFIMGHRAPDMDSIGSSIGVLQTVQVNDKDGYIVLDHNERNPGIEKLMGEVDSDRELHQHFVLPNEALELKTENSLLIIVDVHKPSLVMDTKLVDSISRKVVIDHHRRGEEFIPDPLLVYMEPYASSTSELVTELLEYQSNHIQMSTLVATAMLAGIVVDTKSFAFRTGSRTFEAASYLRHHGADTSLVQKFLKEDLEQFVQRAKIVENAEIYRDQVAISIAQTGEKYGQVLIAQAADTLLTMNNVTASFVISKRPEGFVSISARSLGDLNVQVIMEKMNGGGHLTNAATQIEDMSEADALQWLKEVINEYIEGGAKS